MADQVDLPGFNYKPMFYPEILRDHPKWIVYGSETASTVSSRGVYHLPLVKYQKDKSLQVTSYDIIAPPWATAPDVEFDMQDRYPSLLGEFVWTGFDYLGEPTPYEQREGQKREAVESRLAFAQLLFRHRGPLRVPKGPLLPLQEPLVPGAGTARPAALELGRPRRADDSGDGLHECGRGRALPERPLARQANGWAWTPWKSPSVRTSQEPEVHIEVPADVERAVPAWSIARRRQAQRAQRLPRKCGPPDRQRG